MKKILCYLLLMLITQPIYPTGAVAEIESDPCQRINYNKAFDLSSLHKKYAALMEELGCAENVFKDAAQSVKRKHPRENGYFALDMDDDLTDWQKELKNYQTACIRHLYKERRAIITRPAKECALIMTAIVGFTAGMSHLTAGDMTGASVISTTITSLYYIPILIRSLYNLAYTPPQPIDKYEIKYVINQCFIPKKLWPILLTKFLLARNNFYQQQDALDFIGFTLGLTTFKSTSEDKSLNFDLKGKQRELSKKIDEFFEDYEDCDPLELQKIKTNALNFFAILCGEKREMRYLYLVGKGGIGKTHFVHQLARWIEEIYPAILHLEEPTITTALALEGDEKRPGMYLKALRNQCQQRKKAALVFVDEANWFNDEEFQGPGKRVFNGDQTRLVTTYFGYGPNGDGVDIDLPPTLTILAGNEEIRDEALLSRFDCFNFPTPKAETLLSFAVKLIENHEDAEHIPGVLLNKKITLVAHTKISEAIKGKTNFRDIQSLIPRLIRMWEEEQRA